MGKFCLSVFAGAGLLLALVASADAGGRTGQSGQAFIPPGFGHVATTPAPSHADWTTNTSTGQTFIQPPGWSNNHPHWNDSLGTPLPPGLAKCPSGLTGC
jgi:hypothetical protein